MIAALHGLFGRHQKNGEIVFPYQTLVYFAQLKPPGEACAAH
jgi:hypothetical protein